MSNILEFSSEKDKEEFIEEYKKQSETIADLEAKLNSYEEFYKANGFKSKDDFIGYVINTMLNKEEKANIIKDLEAKLAESEKKQEYLFSSNCEYVSQIEELKQQLAEKEEFLKIAYEDIDELQNENDKLEQKLASNSKWLKLLDKQFVQIRNHNQDKIELLEKVDKKVDELVDDYAHFDYSSWCVYINTLISEIKGE